MFFFVQDPPEDTWNCNNISVYYIHLYSKTLDYGQRNTIRVAGDTPGNLKNVKSAVIPDLIPATEYCVTMSFTNGQEMSSPKSEEKCIVTLQTSTIRNKKRPNDCNFFHKDILPPTPTPTPKK